jgi:hypothetical protein
MSTTFGNVTETIKLGGDLMVYHKKVQSKDFKMKLPLMLAHNSFFFLQMSVQDKERAKHLTKEMIPLSPAFPPLSAQSLQPIIVAAFPL